MDRFDEATNYGLVLTAVEMGQTVTEAGAISAVAAFFRQKLDACAWTENAFVNTTTTTTATTATAHIAVPPSTASVTGAPPPLLRLALSASGSAASANYRVGVHTAPPHRPLLDLVVSRGPGPAFSASETRVAAQAAALLRQAIARVRDRGSLAAAEAALECSLRGMQEASEAVAALVAERERQTEHQERQRVDAIEEHRRALLTAAAELARARAETEGFRRRLVEAEEAVAVVAGAAGSLCRLAASEIIDGAFFRGEGEGAGERVGAGAEIGDLIAEVERAARKSLRCFFARVERASQDEAAVLTVANRTKERDASPAMREARREPLQEPLRDGERRSVEEDRARNLKLRVPVPRVGCDPASAPLVLSLRRSSKESGFTKGDERLASVLAACLSTAMSTLHEKRHSLMCVWNLEAERKARAEHKESAAVAAAAASAEARDRRDRAIAGTRALAAAAQASEARAESGAAAAARAERQTEALRHLLSGLGAAGDNHAAVAEVVAERAAAAVSTCVSAVLLTPRQGKGRGGRYGTASAPAPPPRVDAGVVDGGGGGDGGSDFVFSPDPRVWAAGASETHRRRGGPGKNRERGKKSGRWAEAVESAASRAASTGKTVCVRDGAVGTSLGAEAGTSYPVFVACFSPVCASAPASSCEPASKRSGFGAKENLRPAGSGVAVRRNAVPGQRVWPSRVADRSVCVIAWMLCLGARVLDADGNCRSNARSERSCDQTPTTAPTADAAAASAPAAAAATEDMIMTTPPTLPPWVFAAMEAVGDAVGLAVSLATASDSFDVIGQSGSATCGVADGWGGLAAASSSTGGSITVNALRSRAGGNGLLSGGRSEEGKKSRDEDLARLRDGTSALSGRVQTLEKRAAGLRASEARSAAALARARVDAMAAKGQLQLAGLERDRLLSRLQESEVLAVQREVGVGRRPLAAARSRANHRDDAVPPLGRRDGGDRTASAFISAWGPSKESTDIVEAVATSARARPDGGSWAAHEVYVPGGVGTVAAAATTSAEGRTAAATGHFRGGEATRRIDSPEGADVDDASSQALQRMASLHARLSDSLRRGGVSWRMDEEAKIGRQA